MKKIAIIGPESSGKTTLAKTLAREFNGVMVEEFARTYLNRLNRPYTLEDVINIAIGQALLVEEANNEDVPLIIADTDLIVIKVWCEVRFGHCPPEVEVLLSQQQFDHYLLCAPDLEWVDDPMREHNQPTDREMLFNRYRGELISRGDHFSVVSDQGKARLEMAGKIMSKLIS